MRIGAFLAILLSAASAGDPDPFRGPAREVTDKSGRFRMRVPEKWQVENVAGNRLLHVTAPGHLGLGGHEVFVDFEPRQADAAKQRARYIEHDKAKDPSAKFQELDKPFFGYRVDMAGLERKLAILRAFLVDGPDGVVVTATSRLDGYDQHWAKQIEAVVASVSIAAAAPAPKPAAPEVGPVARVRDAEARVSLVVPERWKLVAPKDPEEWLVLSLGGADAGPRLAFAARGVTATPGLVLGKVFHEWKQSYGDVFQETLEGDPPRMIVRNRKPGSVDYVTALQSGKQGYTVTLTVRESEFEKLRADADEAARSAWVSGTPYVPPEAPPASATIAHKNLVVVHSADDARARAVAETLPAFEKAASAFVFGEWRKASPLRVLVVAEDALVESSHRFGEAFAVYDPLARMVVCVPPPAEGADVWRGRLFGEMMRALLHRDLPFPAPPWLREGAVACLEAAGRAGAVDAAHPALVGRLVPLAESASIAELPRVLAATDVDFLREDAVDLRVAAWGYAHLMLFGKGPAASAYRKWSRALAAARAAPPAFDTKGLEKARDELAKHAIRLWGGKG